MPFKSEAQRKKFHVLEAQGKMSKATVHEWEHATKNKKDLPEHVKKSYDLGAKKARKTYALE